MEKVKVCVIDGTNIAQLAKVLSEDQKFYICIIEEHPYEGISKTKGFAVCRDIIAYQIKTRHIYTCVIPVLGDINLTNFLVWYRLFKIKKMVYQVFDDIGVDLSSCRIYGGITSTIMNFLPDCTEIVQLDHGVECVGRYLGEFSNDSEWKIKKRNILKYFTGFHYLRWHNVHTGYTFANCNNDWFINISYKKFRNDYFRDVISKCSTFYEERNVALVLLETQGGYENGMRVNGKSQYVIKLDFDRLFRSMLEKLNYVDEVLVKFHPVIYMEYRHEIGDVIKILKAQCKEKNIRCLDVTEVYRDMLTAYIPAEFYINYLPIKVLVSVMSTAVLNVSSMNSSVRTICYSDFLYKLYDEYTDNIDDINQYVENVRFYG